MPKVSVIIPNYNHARFLRQRTESILGQTYQDFEVILLDDCSTDESQSILREYAADPRVRIELNEKNSGSTFKQWNKGVRLARGEFVWIAESDDYADARFLERLVAVLEAEPEGTFVYCRSWCVAADGRASGFIDPELPEEARRRWTADYFAEGSTECRNYMVRCNTVPNASAVVFRKAAWQRVGGADETLRLCGDWRLWAAMALEGRIMYVSEPLNYYRAHDASVRSKSKLTGLDVAEALQVIRWILDRVTPQEAVLRKTYKTFAGLWIPALLSLRIPFSSKETIWCKVRAVDPHPILSSLRAAPAAAWAAVRNSAWHPILNWTRPLRHSIGLNQSNISAALKRNRREP